MLKSKLQLLLLCIITLSCYTLNAQVPGVKSSKYLTSQYQGYEFIYDAKPIGNKGFILVGVDTGFTLSYSNLIEKTQGGRPWIVKTDSVGNTIWKNTFDDVEPYYSAFVSVAEAPDGGFVTVGYAGGYPDTSQLIIVKYSGNGSLVWQKIYGGTGVDKAFSIAKTLTNGYIITGYTTSNDGDVTGNHSGVKDVWVLRIDDNGNIIWKKCFGGTLNETGQSVIQARDYGFIVAGSASSIDGDLTGSNGYVDGWLLKTDSSGNLLWQKNYGGWGYDVFRSVIVSQDNSIVVAGNADSTPVITNGTKLQQNFWVVKTTATGTPIWSIAYGGPANESAFSIQQMIDQSYLVTGFTQSNNGDVSGNNGNNDAWLIRLSTAGDILWQKAIGTSKNEYGFVGLYLSENEFVVAGTAEDNANQTSDGYFVQLGNSNLIKGNLYIDANLNGIRDAGELSFNNAIVKTQKLSTVLTTQPNAGRFAFDIDTGAYTTTVQIFNPYYTVLPTSKSTNFTTYFNVDSFGFAIQPIPNMQDLIVHLIPTTPARPGFKSYYLLNYKNIGTSSIASGNVKLIKDSRTTLSLSLPLPASVVADTITWNYTNLQPLDSVSIFIEMQVATPPTVNINDTLKFTALVLPIAGDLTPVDDSSRLKQRVVGAYDPNDKQESFGGRIPLKDVMNGAYINYVIRFQNTGNDTAFTVRLLDTLDTKLDWNSFQMIGSSHNYNLSIKDGNKLKWTFSDIKLPDSTINFNRSIGYIAFRIKPKANLVVNDIIQNSASIYFDYNLPIVTNKTNTVVSTDVVSGIRDIQNNDMKLIVAPNPNAGQSILQISGKLKGKFEMNIIDNAGRVIMTRSLVRNSSEELMQVSVDLQELPAGVYYIQLRQKEKLWWQKLVLQ